AVADRGYLIAQGPITDLINGGQRKIDIGCDDAHVATDLLDDHPAVRALDPTADGVRVTLAGPDGVAAINARLVNAGVAVFRIQPVHESLEQRFLEITSRVGAER
ncbi:MAG: hypothetical protein JO244_06455, partial [Solirubrobacterales bacterium]|nr:hypothetical protein [Solirubrobacterales bacterium]